LSDVATRLGIARKKTFIYAEKSEEKRREYLNEVSKIPENDRVYVAAG
jgi:hypothetical protein